MMTLTNEWKEEAHRRFPELHDRFQAAETPYMLWFELQTAFARAYHQEPRDEDLIRRIYGYYRWCDLQPAGKTAEDDLGTCVAVCFLEHIPDIPEALEDMPRWFNRTDIVTMKEVFSYHAGPEGYEKILAQFDSGPKSKGKLGSQTLQRRKKRRK